MIAIFTIPSLQPQSQIVAGYAPLMPSFAGQIGEEDLVKLIALHQITRAREALNELDRDASHRRQGR